MKLTSMALIATTATCTVGTQMLLKTVSASVAGLVPELSIVNMFRLVQFALTNPVIPAAILLQGCGFVLWIVVLSREHAGVALAIGGASVYILTALAEALIFGNRFSFSQLFALTLVSVGAVLLAALPE